ncbi:MAG: hypothetical protein AABW53_02910 [Nanoarchaeota archaeon]
MTRAQELGLKLGQKLFEGEYRAKMAELRKAGLTPWSTEDVMDARNDVNSNPLRWENYFDTDFGIAGTEKEIYLLPRSERLHAVTPQTKLTTGGLPLKDAISEARAYNKKDLILGRELTEEEARSSPVWLAFADGGQERLDTYVERTFRFGKDRFDYNGMMGIFVPSEKQPIERAVALFKLSVRSLAVGYHLFNYGTRSIVVRGGGAPEAHAPKKSPYREDPRSDLEIFLSEQSVSKEELSRAVELYKIVKERLI